MGLGAWIAAGRGTERGGAAAGVSFIPWDDVRAAAGRAGPVDRDTATGLPGVGRGVSILASVIASLPPEAVRYDDLPEVPAVILRAPPVLSDPDPWWHGPSSWRYAAVLDLVLDGNVFADKDADPDRLGFPRRLPLIEPARVTWETVDGRGTYVVAPPDGAAGDRVPMDPARMFHAAVDVASGRRMGRGIIDTYQATLRLIREVEAATAVVMRSGRPVGVLSVDDDMDDTELAALKAGFLAGVRGDGVAALRRATFGSVSWNASDLALVDSRAHNLRLAADMTGVPPYLLGVPSESRVYSNNEAEWVNLIRISATKYVLPLQDALTRAVPRGQTVRFPVDRLQRPDAKTRWEIHEIAARIGATDVTEIRQDEGRGPLPQQPDQPPPPQEGSP